MAKANFDVVIRKTCGSSKPWTNTYTMQIEDVTEVSEAPVAAAVQKIVAMEKAIHLADVSFVSATVSKHVPVGTEKANEDMLSIPLSGNGTHALGEGGDDHLPKSMALKVGHVPASGRSGASLYRRALPSVAWEDQSGHPVFHGDALTVYSDLVHTHYVGAGFPKFVLMDKTDGFTSDGRQVLDLKIQGIVARQENRRKKAAAPTNESGFRGLLEGIAQQLEIAAGTAIVLKGANKILDLPAMEVLATRAGAALARLLPLLV